MEDFIYLMNETNYNMDLFLWFYSVSQAKLEVTDNWNNTTEYKSIQLIYAA